jgi:serine/threonine protein kinase
MSASIQHVPVSRLGRRELVSGRVVAGRYQLVRLLGRGGMGAVWLADDPLASRMVAVKELRAPEGLSAAERDVMKKRALKEARSAGQIQHPNTVILHDVIPASEADDAIYLIMEYVDGVTLAQAVERDGRLGEQQAAAICLQLLSVLAEAHKRGIVHRDIKSGGSCTAISSLPTSCSRAAGWPSWPTSASRIPWATHA